MTTRPGELIDVRFTKWGGGRHYEFQLEVLGTDEHGVWAAGDIGTRLTRPGHAFTSAVAWVSLFPHEQPWTASFHDPAHEILTFVDMSTVPVWTGRVVTMVDLDLDVVHTQDGRIFVDDEGEFELHRKTLGYPDDVVALARDTADGVLAAVRTGAEPFGEVRSRWLAAIADPSGTGAAFS